jgi:hypothetical protein
MIEISPEFRTALEKLKKSYPELSYLTGSQWCLESNFGRSILAKENFNFAGLGYRDLSNYLPLDTLQRVHEVTYMGQDQDRKSYLKLDDPADFAQVFFAFLKRPIYKIQFGGRGFSEQNLYPWKWVDHPLLFLSHIATKGFCGWTPSVKRKDYETDEEYYRDTHADYVKSVLECSLSDNYRQIYNSLGA